jgi:hypothetical protein
MGLGKERRHSRGEKGASLSALFCCRFSSSPLSDGNRPFLTLSGWTDQGANTNETETTIKHWNQDTSRSETGSNPCGGKTAARQHTPCC